MFNHTFLVTGSSRGIGLGLVRELISQGHTVIATCRNPETAFELRQVLADSGQPEPIECDVTSDESVLRCYEAVCKIVSHLDVLINNAGVSNKDHPNEPPSKIRREEFLQVMDTNVAGVIAMTQAFLPLLRKSNGKSQGCNVINISSNLGSVEQAVASFTCTSYRCSKAALNMITKCFALENPDLTFVALHPGWVQTELGGAKNLKPPLTTSESAKAILDVSDAIGRNESGTFWSFEGVKIPY